MSDAFDLVGYAAGLLTSFAYVPQVVRLWRTRSVADISLPTFCLLTVGIGLWLLYGLGTGAGPIIFANAIGMTLTLVIVAMKLWFGRKSVQGAPPLAGPSAAPPPVTQGGAGPPPVAVPIRPDGPVPPQGA